MFDVTASWLSSITFKNLLYLNLAPYLFNSVEFAYLDALVVTIVETSAAEGAKFVL